MSLLKLADAIAAEAHAGQVDKVGSPYIDHPRQVAAYLARAGHPEEVLAVALLHDVLEDTDLLVADLISAGIPVRIAQDVAALSFRYYDPQETRDEYYARVLRGGERARVVKLADVRHNQARLGLIEDEATRARLTLKYERAMHALA